MSCGRLLLAAPGRWYYSWRQSCRWLRRMSLSPMEIWGWNWKMCSRANFRHGKPHHFGLCHYTHYIVYTSNTAVRDFKSGRLYEAKFTALITRNFHATSLSHLIDLLTFWKINPGHWLLQAFIVVLIVLRQSTAF